MTRVPWIGATALALLAGAVTVWPSSARADIANFQLDGKIYNKWLYSNDGTQGSVWLGNPAHPDNFTGDNGVASELELGIRATVSKRVKAGARLQSRWGAVWQDWWENGDIKFENGAPISNPGDTTGESLGMNHAQYIKLRGFWIDVAPPIRTVENVRVGSTDMAMFNAWTIGKARYIDRDNYRGIFLRGGLDKIPLKYEAAVVADPKLFGGPGWNTGNGDLLLANPLITQDWAYALKLDSRPINSLQITAIGTLVKDREFNLSDPDAQNTTNPNGKKDGAVDLTDRYTGANATLEVNSNPTDWLHVNAFGALSYSDVDPAYAFNGVELGQGFSPIVFDRNVKGGAGKLRVDATDPLDIGLSLSGELFSIGENYNAILGARREADVLLTDGFMEGGQLPTLNIANEFMDWDEPWFESCIGWKGLTLVGTQIFGVSQVRAEFTYLGYNTNAQDRDVDHVYPGFLYPDGFTDVDFYDYANTTDRGRDLRAVYQRYENRHTQIAAVWYDTVIPAGKGIDIKAKAKHIRDIDLRKDNLDIDNYKGNISSLRVQAGYQFSNELRGFVGDEINYWREGNRFPLTGGNPEAGYYNYTTRKNKLFAGLEYNFAGAKLKYVTEWIEKDQDRSADPLGDFSIGDIIPHPYGNAGAYQVWNRIRAKASFEAAW